MEEIRISKIQSGYTIYQSGFGTVFLGDKTGIVEIIDKLNKLMKGVNE